MLYIFIGIVLIFTMTLIGAGVFLRVLEIEVEGSVRYTQDEIIEVSGLSLGSNLLFLNTQRIARNIRESKPFVDDVIVTRVPPNSVEIEIIESAAVARVILADDTLIIDSMGRVLDTFQDGVFASGVVISLVDLIEVHGVEPENPVAGNILRSTRLDANTRIQSMIDVLYSLEREGLEDNVTYIDVSNITNIRLGYLSMYSVVLGGLSNIRTNLARLEQAVEQAMRDHPNQSGVINMTNTVLPPQFTPHN